MVKQVGIRSLILSRRDIHRDRVPFKYIRDFLQVLYDKWNSSFPIKFWVWFGESVEHLSQ
jgi:hypothetical protein